MKKIICFIISVLLCSSFILTGCDNNNKKNQSRTTSPKPTETASSGNNSTSLDNLRAAAQKRNMLIGAAIEPKFLDDPSYSSILSSQYNFITPENRMKWGFIHPKKDTYDFTGADKIVDFALNNKMKVRGHTLVWHIENPSWLTNQKYTKDEMLAILKDHITNVVGHYKGKVHAWDVVNEVIDVYALRDTLWLKTCGSEYIEKAFIWAHEADPDAKLYINDFFIEEKGVKSDYMYKFVKELLAKKVPIHGVGLQCHFDMEAPPDMGSIYENVKRFTDLGLLVDFTEVDFRVYGYANEEQLKKQAVMYSDLMNIALNFEKVNVFTMWGLTDKHSWVPVTYPEYGAAHIFDDKYKPKPAYYSLLDSLNKGPIKVDYNKLRQEALNKRVIVPSFEANPASKPPVIDGNIGKDEWKDAIIYPFSYNQLNDNDKRPPEDIKNFSGTWRLVYNKNKIYGMVEREDNLTVLDSLTEYENDCFEVFTDYKGEVNQLRALIGADWSFNPALGERKAVWSKNGKILEFSLEVSAEKDLTGVTMGWNIAITDNDDKTGGRTRQLYPINGENTSWQGKDLASLKFIGKTQKAAEKDYAIPAFLARKALKAPTIDGQEDPGIWDNVVKYKLSYNQLNSKDQSSPNNNKDLYCEWKVIYDKNTIYCYVTRVDDKTITSNPTPEENDNVEVFIRPESTASVLRTIVGKNFEGDFIKGSTKAAWNSDGTVLEMAIELPVDDLAEMTVPWNIAISDNDSTSGKRKYQLFPIHRAASTTKDNNFSELTFEK